MADKRSDHPRATLGDDDITPPVRPPSVELAKLWAQECDQDAKRCDAVEISARETARELRAMAEMFRAWELADPDPELRNRAYARRYDLMQRMKEWTR